MHVEMGQDAVLDCDVCSNPPASIRWIREPGDIVSILKIYYIHDVTKHDTGNYTCIATNKIKGKTNIEQFVFSIVLIGPPNVPDNFKVTSNTSTSVCLSWRPGYNGGSTVQFVLKHKSKREPDYVSTGPNLPEDTTQYCVKDLEPKTKYEFLLMAENKFKGRSESNVTSTQAMTSGKTNHITNPCLTNMVALLCVNY